MIHRADHRRRCEHADARDLVETDRDGVRASHLCELPIDGGDARFEPANFVDDERDGVSEQIRERILGILEDTATRASTVRAPTGIGRPCSRNSPRTTLMRAVRAACHWVRTRWSA